MMADLVKLHQWNLTLKALCHQTLLVFLRQAWITISAIIQASSISMSTQANPATLEHSQRTLVEILRAAFRLAPQMEMVSQYPHNQSNS